MWPYKYVGRYVSEDGVRALREYRYHGIDHGILANYVFQPWWRFCVELLPLWLAPNLVTLLGLICMCGVYLCSLWYSPHVTEPAPPWVYVLCAFAMFAYMTLDAIDGKQARRTGSSSPLGELFDHGCDAINTMLTVITISSALQLGGSWLYFWLSTAMYTGFFLAQWEEYHTHIMELGMIGVTEGHCLYMGVMLLTACYGPQYWRNTLALEGLPAFTYRTGLVALAVIGSAQGALINAYKVLRCVWRGEASLVPAFMRLLPVVELHVLSYLWLVWSPQGVPLQQPQLFELLRGFITSYAVGRIILARVTRDKFSLFPVALLPLPFVLLNAYLGAPLCERTLLIAYAVFAAGVYFYFATSVIRQLCDVLGIRAFVIPYPPPQVEKTRAGRHHHTHKDGAHTEQAQQDKSSK